jgi:5-carboxymethyl-2-hydroxymuconate isomerase
MPHLRLEVPEEWLREDFKKSTGFDARHLLDQLVDALVKMTMPDPADASKTVPVIDKKNLKHAIIPVMHAHTAGDMDQRFLHVTLAAGNDTPGRTPELRTRVATDLGELIDQYTANLSGLTSVTVWLQDIDRPRGYSTTAERKKRREGK